MPYKQALKSIHKDNFSKLLLDIQWKILSKALQTIFKKEVKHRFNSLFNLGFWLLIKYYKCRITTLIQNIYTIAMHFLMSLQQSGRRTF